MAAAGAVLPVRGPAADTGAAGGRARSPAGPVTPAHIPLPRTAAHPRPSFRPRTIRTGHDAVSAAALYLTWLGYREVARVRVRTAGGIDLRATGLVAQIDATTRPVELRAVECLWLNALGASAAGVFFSLAGYGAEARARADGVGLPLFVMDLTGAPQPVNSPADELVSTGA